MVRIVSPGNAVVNSCQRRVGSATLETRFAMGMLQVDNLRALYAGKPLLTPVV